MDLQAFGLALAFLWSSTFLSYTIQAMLVDKPISSRSRIQRQPRTTTTTLPAKNKWGGGKEDVPEPDEEETRPNIFNMDFLNPNKDPEPEPVEEEKKGSFISNLNPFSRKKAEAEPEPQQESSDGGFLGIFNRGDDSDKRKREKEKQAQKKQQKRERDKKKEQKENETSEGDGGISFLKGISSRFGKGDEDDNAIDDESDINIPDSRSTFVTFQRKPDTQTKLPSTGTIRVIPPDISQAKPPIKSRSTSSSYNPARQTPSTSRPVSPKTPPKASVIPTTAPAPVPIPIPRKSKTQRIVETIKSRNREKSRQEAKLDDDKNENDESDKSVFGRVQSMVFGDKVNVDTGGAKASGSNRTSTSSVASKFMSGFMESVTSSGSNKEEWVAVLPKARITPGEIVPVEVAGLDLIIVASKDAQNIYAMVNSCPHLGTPLEIGFLERRPIEANRYADKEIKDTPKNSLQAPTPFQEADIAAMLASDGCEDCIICPLHKTAFALKSGEVRGEWCPYPPVVGKLTAAVKNSNSAAVFDVRTRGKNIEVRLNTPLLMDGKDEDAKKGRKGKG